MSGYSLQRNALEACEEMIASINLANQKEPNVFPKSRRVEALSNMSMRNFKMHFSQQGESSDSKAEAELLQIMLNKELHAEEFANQVALSPPYFCGSPPIRTANPIVQDARFGDEKNTPISAILSPTGLSSPSLASVNRGCVRVSLGPKPAAVRVEGFDCPNKDRENSGVSAVA
ncbi:uncharacterized protein LOC130735281 [Lotus japonicus]|uniref:uncharacterized protein LOC130735281 n=1 Tax=Lotus japonicus TaxID=34305 RepID=UPI00258FCD52|nr:uncharacterized protein LOC130735281 [Lotus japonicus]